MKKRKPTKREKPTPAKIQKSFDETPAAKFFPGQARLEKKNIRKVVYDKPVQIPASVSAKAKRQKERRRASMARTPRKYKAALSAFGLGRADSLIARRGAYYTGAGLYQIKRNKLAVKNNFRYVKRKDGTRGYEKIQSQNVFDYRNAATKGWVVVIKNGVPQKTLMREKAARRDQKAARKAERVRVMAAKTGKSVASIKKIFSNIRAQELRKLKNFRKTAKYKNLTKAQKLKNNINNRMAAIFGAICDILEIQGS